jgi:hypothetical protein
VAAGARPIPTRDLAQGVELLVGLCVRVLHRNLRAELDVLSQRLSKRRIIRQPDVVSRAHVQLDETLALLLADLEPPMHRDQMLEPAQFTRETVRPAESLDIEGGEVLDMARLAGAKERLKQRVTKHASVKRVDEAAEAWFATGVLEERLSRHCGA